MARIQKNWQPHADEFDRVVPFSDPAQVEFFGFHLRELKRMNNEVREIVALFDELVNAVNAIAQAQGEKRRVSIVRGPDGRLMFLIQKFAPKPIQRKGPE